MVRLTGDRPAYVRCLVALAAGRLAPSLAASMSRPGEVRVRTDALFQEVGMSKRRLTVVTTVLCLMLGATAWFSVSTVPLRAIAAVQGGIQSSSETPPPAADERRVVILDFVLPSGHRPQTRGWEGQRMRIWLRDAGKLGFVPTFPDDSNQRVIVTVYDLDGAPDRPLGQIEVEVGGAPVTFRAAAPFEIAVPRILGPDFFEALRQEQRRYDAERAARFYAVGRAFRYIAADDGFNVTRVHPRLLGDAHPDAVRVGGNIGPPQKTRNVDPLYPPAALAARVSGVVILEVLIDTDGRVADVEILRSVPLLDVAAVEAVRRWEYTTTVLNGVPVPVIMTVTVNFQLR